MHGILYTLYMVYTFDHIQIKLFCYLSKKKDIEKNLTLFFYINKFLMNMSMVLLERVLLLKLT